ncbi:MAG: hypothetical protein IPP76_12950 [Moraxellaceae bacterium]|nr:hypothetical protein [Moraxellaceae bacterium]
MNIKQVLDEMFSKPSALGNINYQIKQPMLLSEGMAQVCHSWELSGVICCLNIKRVKVECAFRASKW